MMFALRVQAMKSAPKPFRLAPGAGVLRVAFQNVWKFTLSLKRCNRPLEPLHPMHSTYSAYHLK